MTIPFWTRAGVIDLADLQPQDLTAEALGDAMAKINRFGGRTRWPWSVAAHSALVEALCPVDLKPWALLHDAHKVFLGDLTDPAVELLCQSGTRSAIEHAIVNAEARIDRRIASAWGIPVRSMSEPLRRADQTAFLAELWAFLDTPPGPLPPAEADDIDRAMAVLRDLPLSGDWREARDFWLGRIELHAKLGAFTPPRSPDPTRDQLAG